MRSKSIVRTALASVATVALFGSTHLMAEDCSPVKGKIFNSSHTPALGSTELPPYGYVGGASTLGVVALNGGRDLGKMKCALVGVWAGPGEGLEFPEVGILPNFTHTISCDDAVPSPVGEVHSQLTFDTTGSFTGYDEQVTFSFLEYSEVRAGTGKGAFANTTGGLLEIDGTINVATGSIDMGFTGEFCTD